MNNSFTLRNVFKAQGLILGFMLLTGLSAFGQVPEVFSTPGTFTWTCPTGVTSVTVECWGGGGAGGAATATAGRAGGGGGGGSYTTSTISVVPGTDYTITVGAGGTLGPTTSPTFGGNGGTSQFALSSNPTNPIVRASGGTGGGGGTTTVTSGSGGVLGGVYDFIINNAGSGYTTPITVGFTGGGGAGATASATSTLSYISSRVQATTPYTSTPTVTITGNGGSGSGAMVTAVVNLSVDLGTTTMPSISGSAGVVNVGSGAGGAGGNGGGAGGASITVQGNAGNNGTAPGGGGSGGYAASSGGAKNGGLGAAGQVKLSYTVLSVDLTSFQVKNNQKTALLSWTTASEKDNAVFKIEQSSNGKDFQTIGQVKGNGTTTVSNTYNFEHITPSVGINYYRLKQVDFNGTATFSAVRSVVFGKGGLVVKTTLVSSALDIVVGDEAPTTFNIINMAGQTVLAGKAQGAQRLDVSALPLGTYVIRTETGDVARFVKQ